MRINIENCAKNGDAKACRWCLEELARNLKELRDRTDAGDMSSLDEFFQLFRFNDNQQGERAKRHAKVDPQPATPAVPIADEYYLQDSRSYVGNDMLFWGAQGCGYTTDLRKAQVYTKAEALAVHRDRETDIPWPKAYIDAKARPAVDMQHVSRIEALKGTGIELIKPRKPKRETYQCGGCGKFLAQRDYYGNCPHCGTDNRP